MTANNVVQAHDRRTVLTALQRAILVELARECWPVRAIRDGCTGGQLAAAIHLGFSKVPDDEHAAWLSRAGDFDWVRLYGVTRAAYRCYTGSEGMPSPSFRVSFHRAIHTLEAKSLVELVNKQPRTKAKARRRVESLYAARLTLAGLLAVADEPIADDYGGEAFPREPGFMQAVRVSRVYYSGLTGDSGWPKATQYTRISDDPRFGRAAERWMPLPSWREWWEKQAKR